MALDLSFDRLLMMMILQNRNVDKTHYLIAQTASQVPIYCSPYLLQSLSTAVPIYCSLYLLQSLSTAVPIYCSLYLLQSPLRSTLYAFLSSFTYNKNFSKKFNKLNIYNFTDPRKDCYTGKEICPAEYKQCPHTDIS